MEASKLKEIKSHAKALAELLYEETDPAKITTLEGIEKTVRQHLLNYVDPEIGNFLSLKAAEQHQEDQGK